MNWSKLILDLMESGLSQVQIGERIGRSQAWVSAVAQGKYQDVRWNDGDALLRLMAQVGTNKEAA